MTGYSDREDSTLSYYEDNAQAYYNATVNVNMATLYAPFLNYMPSYAHILDAGCGSGRDTLFFSNNGYRVTGFDFSPALVSLASKLTGQKILELSFHDLKFENEFDGVWACSSLLHVPMEKMNGTLSRLSRSLKVNGILYASFKYGTGKHERHGKYFTRFDEKTFDKILLNHPELNVMRYWKTNDLGPGRDSVKWLNILLRKTGPPSS
jgi:SAM-dependent methyltransferase